MPDARLHLTYTFAGPGTPPLDDIVQTFHAIEVMWADATEAITRHVRGHTGSERYQRERRMWIDAEPPALWVPVASSLSEGFHLRVEAITMASPLELLLHLPYEAYVLAGAVSVRRLIAGIEGAWNAPRRIRLEGARLDRDYWTMSSERDEARREYELRAPGPGRPRPGFELESGKLEIPPDWTAQERDATAGA